ncbi:GspH/FimT family pseudopilin [Desulfogranum japonicum]|uniref:GspH/FimT family pseudopilin n=1 Tax=Desulfogranum japonicum TaxID=231447 RepID=UPI000684F9CA|nr:GspH/FimT family pseudopilin [Desulfogranum japonicum]
MIRLKTEHGFTLVEVLTVMVIIAILSAIATPAFFSWLPNLRLRQASRGFFLDMQEAKSLAIKNNTPIGITVTTVSCPGLPNIPSPGGSYTLFTDDGAGGGAAGDGIRAPGEAVIRTTQMPTDVALCNGAAQMASTSFLPTGSPIAFGTVTLNNSQANTSTITLSLSGNIRQN